MELEDRVKRLEEDVSILKNQIRNTLLDIQEQLAADYHPSLRASRRSRTRPTTPQDDEDEDEAEEARPKVRKISLQQLHQPPDDEPAPMAAPDLDLHLTHWAKGAAGRVGAETTRDVLQRYASDGRLTQQQVERVIELANLDAGPAPSREPGVQDVIEAIAGLSRLLAATPTLELDRG